MISPQIAISGFLRKWMCCSIILLEHNPAMSSLRHNSLESHSKNHQCKHVWSTNMTCPEITMVVRTYQVCALTMFALSQYFRVVVSEHKPDMSIYGNYFQILHCIRLGYNTINHVLCCLH